jgi:uncharacterized protein
MTDLAVVDNQELSRVEARLGDAVAGFAAYLDRPGQRVFTHTEVDPAYEGQGIGGRLAREALDQARADGLRVVPRCPFIRTWIDKHPDYADLVDADQP